MKFWDQYKLRIERKRRRIRAHRKFQELCVISLKADQTVDDDIFLFTTIRNEKVRLPFFLDYYRKLGVNHFFFVDNDSSDGSIDYLTIQSDVSVWHSKGSYKRAGFGVDWLNGLQARYGLGHWCLSVDVDEFFVYPYCDTRPLRALTGWLDESSTRSFGAMLVDTYPKGSIAKTTYRAGDDPLVASPYFDVGNYYFERNKKYGNLWIQGGSRQRAFFSQRPAYAPALNKIPLVKWSRGNVYVSSTHVLLPRSLNQVYASEGGQRACGCLMHVKFMEMFATKAVEEVSRRQHYAASREYLSYARSKDQKDIIWNTSSQKYQDWRQLTKLGLMSSGDWA